MDYRIIKSPTKGTLDILKHRVRSECSAAVDHVDAVGLVQGKMIEMICAADIAEKAAGVTVEDIRGTCPQHMILLAIFGDTASVEDAIHKIKQNRKKGIIYDNSKTY
ncbi:MAG: BMC domain-containing protein [Clostridia bacterium]|nr:BMC domain-containing protein [Clostridia bacterium]